MNQYITGAVIKNLREKNHLTQAELAERICVSDKTISKWETAKGYPDISLLEPIAKVFGVSITELLSGNAIRNGNVSANMLRSHFYVCPVCGNTIIFPKIVCGHVGAFNNLIKHTEMAHIFKQTEDGLFMISRFWLGNTMKSRLI